MSYFFYIIISFIPGILWLLYFLQKDNLHPEPKLLIIETFLLGMLISAPILVAQLSFIHLFQPPSLPILLAGTAFIEEYFKYFTLKIHILKSPEFDEPVDAMIYCITAGLGFATIENILMVIKTYTLNGANVLNPLFTLFIRGIGATVLHALASGIIGFALAFSYFKARSQELKAGYLWTGIMLATIVHFLYNYLLLNEVISTPEKAGAVAILLILTAIAISAGFNITKKLKILS